MAHIIEFDGKRPQIADDVFLAPTAVIIGDVHIESGASVWFGAVIRGDHAEHRITIGARTSIQDNCVVHIGDWGPTRIGADVTLGHGAVVESCSIGSGCMIGMNAVVLQNAEIAEECVVAAGAVVREGDVIAARSVVAGVPATVRKTLDGRAAQWIARGSSHYVELGSRYRTQGIG
jgi:carbonic anhydrase/acetyltransferase-like protein (isoleucine patch superfamily)